jgi:divalent metal cation (Fe/Co/Zn/Cd) transporter
LSRSFLVLAAYVLYESASTLSGAQAADRSLAALMIAAASLVVMPILYLLKRRTAQTIGSASLMADAKQTLACVMLSLALLAGAGLNYWLGWQKSDPIAGIVIALYLVREGYEALLSRELCHC